MAARNGDCYVYLLREGETPIYVGKGSGDRGACSRRKHGGELVILEEGLTDDQAFARERHWISELHPENNRSPGGNGGRRRPKRRPRRSRDEIEIDRIGSKRFVARLLLSKVDERNCEQWGRSKLDVSRWREVAYG